MTNEEMIDEEKKAVEIVKGITEDDLLNYWEGPEKPYNAIQTILNLIENLIFKTETQKELLKYKTDKIEKQSKEIEELKEDRKSYTEEYIHNNPWLYKQLNEVYIFRTESKQKEKQAYNFGYRNGCNDTSKFNDKTFIRIDKLKEILGIEEETDSEKILSLLQTLVDENARLEDIEDKKVQIEYNNVFNKGVKSVEDKIKAKIEEVKDGTYDAKIVLQSLLEKE